MTELSANKEVVIIQRRLTKYRVPLFELMRLRLKKEGIRLLLLYGDGTAAESGKMDLADITWATKLPTQYLLGERLCWQPFGEQVKDSDLVIVTQENKLIYNLIALGLKRPRRIAFWGHGRNMQAKNPDCWSERFKRWTSGRADWWFTYTDISTNFVLEDGFPGNRLTVLNNSIDTRSLQNLVDAVTSAQLADLRIQLKLGEAPVGLFLGSLYSEKRIEFLLEAARRIAAAIPGFVLLIVGSGPDRPLVEAAVTAGDPIRYLGPLQNEAKAAVLALADAILNPGLVGLGILDAFVAGIPVLTTDCRLHSPEIAYLQSGYNGLMTEDSLDDYVRTVVDLLRDPARLESLSAGSKRSAQIYSIEAMAERFCDGIVKCLQNPPKAQSQ